ncbi:MAG: hypothetical protein MZV64_58860 [Ignavibacteriales bacterium]|nr:hypothetical protein [Ignavibacteriales bacterium]
MKAEKVVAVLDANRIQPMEFYHAFKIIFLCRLIDGEPRTSNETSAVDFFDLNELHSPLQVPHRRGNAQGSVRARQRTQPADGF